MSPIQTAITGREPSTDQTQPEQALAQFYRAFNSKDLALMKQNWLQSPESAMDNPLGGIKRGWSEIESVYRRVFESRAVVTVEFHDYTLHQASDFFYVVGRERGELHTSDGSRLALKIRTSRLFKKIEGLWKQVHHHGSIDDPELLKSYQQKIQVSGS